MATPFDGLAKEILDLMLRDHGRIETESEAPSLPSQRADIFFIPDAAHDTARRALGLIGRMTDAPCLFEPFHQAPRVDEVIECLRKLLNHRHARALKLAPAAERTWLLCAGRPDTAFATLRATPTPEWPPGFYDLGPALPLAFVVLSELPHDDDTLTLRLTAAGGTLTKALHDLRARFGIVPKGPRLYTTVVQFLLAARRRGGTLAEVLMLDLTEAEEFLRNQYVEGRLEGIHVTLVHQCERKLARSLTDAERDGLQSHIATDGSERVGDALFDLDATAFAVWLANA